MQERFRCHLHDFKVSVRAEVYCYLQVVKVVILIRPKKDKPPQHRFFTEVASSPIFDRLKRVHVSQYPLRGRCWAGQARQKY